MSFDRAYYHYNYNFYFKNYLNIKFKARQQRIMSTEVRKSGLIQAAFKLKGTKAHSARPSMSRQEKIRLLGSKNNSNSGETEYMKKATLLSCHENSSKSSMNAVKTQKVSPIKSTLSLSGVRTSNYSAYQIECTIKNIE